MTFRGSGKSPEDWLNRSSLKEFLDPAFKCFLINDQRFTGGFNCAVDISFRVRVAYDESRCDYTSNYKFLHEQGAKSLTWFEPSHRGYRR